LEENETKLKTIESRKNKKKKNIEDNLGERQRKAKSKKARNQRK